MNRFRRGGRVGKTELARYCIVVFPEDSSSSDAAGV